MGLPHGEGPVSYTHLDVYKRQAENEAIYHHETGGMAEDGTTVEYAALNDHGYDWWTNEGKLVLEDPEYCASVSFTVGSWIEMLDKYSAG